MYTLNHLIRAEVNKTEVPVPQIGHIRVYSVYSQVQVGIYSLYTKCLLIFLQIKDEVNDLK